MARKVIGIGETVLDIVFREGRPQAAVPGGSVFNSMVSLGRTLGAMAAEGLAAAEECTAAEKSTAAGGRHAAKIQLLMESQVGDDQVADLVADFMKANHVDIAGIQRAKGQSTVSLAMLDANNNAHYEFYRDKELPAFRTPETHINPDDIAIFGSFFAVSDATGPQTAAFIRRAQQAGAIVYYDINFRKNHPVTPAVVEANIALADIVRGSSEDIAYLYGTDNASEVYEQHIAKLCPNFICTRGADAAEVFSPGVRASYPTVDVPEILSTIGAGDNFNAGILYSIIRKGFGKQRIHALSEEDWAAMIGTAMRFSANVCASLFNYVDPEFVKTLE